MAIVASAWDAGAMAFELVAVRDGAVVGHVLGTSGDVEGTPILGVAPLSVAPERQRSGIGTALMSEMIRAADGAGLPMVVLLGNPAYYSRFGFEAAWPLGVTYEPAGPQSPNFQLRRLTNFDPSFRGRYRYDWERRQT